jgi:hypothetical protein
VARSQQRADALPALGPGLVVRRVGSFGMRFLLLKLLLNLDHGRPRGDIRGRRLPFERACFRFQCVRDLEKSLNVVELDQASGKPARLTGLVSLVARLLETRIEHSA